MAADRRPNTDARSGRERRPAIWPWLLMPLIVLAVFCALLRMHHRAGAPWAAGWTHASDDSTPPAQQP
ncbi:MAG: hypothetical protein ACLPTM_02685 [Steroidobacteraceae bacterium]